MVKDILAVLVVLVIGIPFAYMVYDLSREIIRQLNEVMFRRLKPVFIQLLNLR